MFQYFASPNKIRFCLSERIDIQRVYKIIDNYMTETDSFTLH